MAAALMAAVAMVAVGWVAMAMAAAALAEVAQAAAAAEVMLMICLPEGYVLLFPSRLASVLARPHHGLLLFILQFCI